jgi:hypothetical protein
MSAGDVLAVVAATVVTMLVAVLAATLVALVRTLRDLRDTANALYEETLPLLEAARDSVSDAASEVDRVERLVTSAELLGGAVDGASRIAARTLRSPVVKVMAFRTGVSRAAQKLREGEEPVPRPRRGRNRRRARRSRARETASAADQLSAKPKAS